MSKIQKTLVGIVALALLALIMILIKDSQKIPETNPIAGWSNYTNDAYKLSSAYPAGAQLITDKTIMSTTGYFPTCNTDTALACIYFASSTYPNSNFNSAGISLNVISDKKSETDCYALNPYERSLGSDQVIRGVTFKTFVAGDAAMSHQSGGTDYRTFHNNTCFEITTRINTSTFEVYAEGSIVRFTDMERQELENTIKKIVETFQLDD